MKILALQGRDGCLHFAFTVFIGDWFYIYYSQISLPSIVDCSISYFSKKDFVTFSSYLTGGGQSEPGCEGGQTRPGTPPPPPPRPGGPPGSPGRTRSRSRGRAGGGRPAPSPGRRGTPPAPPAPNNTEVKVC